ncbi:hypothetical protein ACHAWF_010773 [Thalassiosira exigua]
MPSAILRALAILSAAVAVRSFAPAATTTGGGANRIRRDRDRDADARAPPPPSRPRRTATARLRGRRADAEVSRYLTDFTTADGAVVDPYKTLRVSRDATLVEIKGSYRRLSRKLHPDMVAQRDVLPGRCANLEEVRDEWERVKLSYEVLSDPKTRKSYDRNSSVASVLEDPSGAMARAAVGGALGGVGMVLGGAWKIGEAVVGGAAGAVAKAKEEAREREERERREAEEAERNASNGSTDKSNSVSKGGRAKSTMTASELGSGKAKRSAGAISETARADAMTVITPTSGAAAKSAVKSKQRTKTKPGGGKGFGKP